MATLGSLAAQLTSQGDKLGMKLSMASAALDLLAGERPLPLPSPLELGDDHRLIELAHRAEYLTDQLRRRRVVQEGLRTVGCNQLDAESLQLGKADFLNHCITIDEVVNCLQTCMV